MSLRKVLTNPLSIFSGASVKGGYIGEGTNAISPGAKTVLQLIFKPTTPPGTQTIQSSSIFHPIDL